MEWHDIRDPNDAELDRLAERYRLHPLHIEDCRHREQNAKVEDNEHYLFVVLKPVDVQPDGTFDFPDLDLFLGRDFFITVQESECASVRRILDQLHASAGNLRADQLLYRVTDAVVDSYLPALDRLVELTDALEDEVLERPSPAALEKVLGAKRNLIEMRRVIANMRDVAGHLLRSQSDLISRDLWPFLRDVYDHVARNLDTVEVQRDLLNGAMEIYLSSTAQKTNQVMKVLTVLGTIALPAIVVSGFYGMNLHGLPWSESPYGSWIAAAIMGGSTLLLLALLRFFRWL
jgi:magnesium transporter